MEANMALEEDIRRLAEQERLLVFSRFGPEEAWALGNVVREVGLAQSAPIAVDVSLRDRTLFHCAMPGSTTDNAEWIRRKRNTALRLWRSSYAVGRSLALSGETQEEAHNLPDRRLRRAWRRLPDSAAGRRLHWRGHGLGPAAARRSPAGRRRPRGDLEDRLVGVPARRRAGVTGRGSPPFGDGRNRDGAPRRSSLTAPRSAPRPLSLRLRSCPQSWTRSRWRRGAREAGSPVRRWCG